MCCTFGCAAARPALGKEMTAASRDRAPTLAILNICFPFFGVAMILLDCAAVDCRGAHKRAPTVAAYLIRLWRYHLIHHSLEIKASWFLPRRKLLEGLQPLAHDRLRRHHCEHPVCHPLAVEDALIAT